MATLILVWNPTYSMVIICNACLYRMSGPSLFSVSKALSSTSAHMRGHCQEGWKPGMPCMQKKVKELGSKSDLQTKKLLKYLGMGVGIAGGCVVVWLMFRVSS